MYNSRSLNTFNKIIYIHVQVTEVRSEDLSQKKTFLESVYILKFFMYNNKE